MQRYERRERDNERSYTLRKNKKKRYNKNGIEIVGERKPKIKYFPGEKV